jgi:homoserine dehydrogenase
MNKINVGLIGFGNVGSGVVKFLQNRKSYIRDRFDTEFVIQKICDLKIHEYTGKLPEKVALTTDYKEILNDPEIEVVIELIGGLHPAKEIIMSALEKGKHVVTANKSVIANFGKSLFEEANRRNRNIYFETAVMAGVPVIKSIT